MKSNTETLKEFYQTKLGIPAQALPQDEELFNVFRSQDFVGPCCQPMPYRRRDFYKIRIGRGEHIFHYSDKSIKVSGPTLLFFNPNVPYVLETLEETGDGFFCIFSRTFFQGRTGTSWNELPMYAQGGYPAYTLTEEQYDHVCGIFAKMQEEYLSDYIFKLDLIRNYIMEVTHFALKSRPNEVFYKHPNSRSRITAIFSELLERQFPIERPNQRLTMRSAKDYADQLAVHVNHLNRAIRTTTGRTTTDLIAERVVSEAKSLLKHKDWNIAEISYCLGFEEPSHFNNFFKKQTNLTPSDFRHAV